MKIGIVIFILFISLVLRLHNYALYPQRGATSDEYTYTFLGISLIEEHVPISWSFFPDYKNKRDLAIKKLYFPIVYPYFDHPPLNGLLIGGWSILNGQDSFEKVELRTIRLVPIFLSMVSSMLVFLLGLRLYGYKTGVWALLIYTTTAIFVMNGRVVFAENLLTPLFLGAIYLFSLYKNSLTKGRVIMLSVLSGLSFLTKELGIAVFLSLLYLFISEKIKLKFILILIVITGLFVLSYLAYGAYYDWGLFWKIVIGQSSREVGPETLLMLTSTPIVVNKIYYDGWYFFGFLCLFFGFAQYKENKLFLVPSLVYFVLLIFSLTKIGEMGWYMIPLFPFMAILSARALVRGFEKHNLFIFNLFLFVGLYEIKYLYGANFGLTTTQFRIIFMIMILPLLLSLMFEKKQLFKIIGVTWFYLFIFGNILLTYNYIHPS